MKMPVQTVPKASLLLIALQLSVRKLLKQVTRQVFILTRARLMIFIT